MAGWTSRTYLELWQWVESVSLSLGRLGVGPGDRVVILSGSRPECVVADLATCGGPPSHGSRRGTEYGTFDRTHHRSGRGSSADGGSCRWAHTHFMQRRPSHVFTLRAIGPQALMLMIAACAPGVGAPDTGGSVEPSASPAWVTFSSERYGYSILHPAGWEVLERGGEFRLTALRPRHPGTDTLGPPESHKLDLKKGIVVIGARDLGPDESLEEFTTEASSATQCGPHGRDTTSLAGEPAELRKFECGGIFWHQVTALHGGRGYLVWVTRPLTTDFLESFSFTD